MATSTTAGPDASGRNDLGRKGWRGTNGADKTENMHGSASAGETIASIDRAAGTSEPMIKQYAMVGHLSPEPPSTGQPKSEVIAINDSTINSWCDNCGSWHKQRHTAVMMYAWLQDKLDPSSPCSTLAAPRQMSARRDGQRVRLQGMSEVSAI